MITTTITARRGCSWPRSPATDRARTPASRGRACTPLGRLAHPVVVVGHGDSIPWRHLRAVVPAPQSVLSDGTIRRLVEEGRIVIDPWDPALVQPASVDLRLGDSFRVFHNHRAPAIDLREPPHEPHRGGRGRRTTSRSSSTPASSRSAARWSGSSCPTTSSRGSRARLDLGRLGLIVHATAGFVDPGFKGTLTLEITNLTRVPIKLYAGLPIAQLSFMTLDAPAERPYGSAELGSHYQGQVEATESRYERRLAVR